MGTYSPEQQGLGSPLHKGSSRTCRSTPGSLIYMICLTALGLELEVKFVIPVVIFLKYVYNTPETNKCTSTVFQLKKREKVKC